MLRTHSSSFAMSVSSSHGFTSNKIEDLAIRVGSNRKGGSSPLRQSQKDQYHHHLHPCWQQGNQMWVFSHLEDLRAEVQVL
uniref:Uncharacterized protein n=1 Tax=Oryzias melastigma TaxID=30732 RepID=A0A3B3BMP9_ORYME